MNIIFMGTPDFAAVCLQTLIDNSSEYDCSLSERAVRTPNSELNVITPPDKPKGRKYELTPCAVKVLAQENNIPVYQPSSMRDEAAEELIKSLAPDLIVVVAYGKILPKNILDIPKYGCINIHASLLPKYRGSSPIHSAIIGGETVTGITSIQMDEGMDTGDMLLKKELPIEKNDTTVTLHDKLAVLGGEVLVETIKNLDTIKPQKQNENEATYTKILNKEDGKIDWNESAEQIRNKIRGLQPWPSAYTEMDGKILKIFFADVVKLQGKAGDIMTDNGKLIIYCGENAILINELQIENKKRMKTDEFLRGYKF